MANRHPHVGAPKRLYSLLELRALGEIAMLPFGWPLMTGVAKGDGHPVLLLPGFMADERTLFALKRFLRGRGYHVVTWGLGRNLGLQPRHVEALVQTIRHLHHQTGRPVSLVGWSLGGVFAMLGAHEAAGCVRQVITLGSPVSIDEHGSRASPLVQALYRLIAHPMGPAVHAMQPRIRRMRQRELPAVPISCLYSLSDGIVPPQEATIDGDPSHCENIRVAGSHIGLGFNPMVLAIVADRLSQQAGAWKPFKPTGASGAMYRILTHARLPL